jgi:hypothetical protein
MALSTTIARWFISASKGKARPTQQDSVVQLLWILIVEGFVNRQPVG